MDHNYRFYLTMRVQCFESSKQDSSSFVYSLGASVGPGDGDLDSCTSSDGDSDDESTFFFWTYLGCGLAFGIEVSSFSTSPSSFFGS